MMEKKAVEELERMAKECQEGEEAMEAQDADHVLCEFLVALGYTQLVDAYWHVPKWYKGDH